ncbi:MAG: NAD-dependent epimerase/dehydratase family protein [Oligoflexales bacterium]
MKIAVTGALGHIGSEFIRSIGNTYPNAEVLMFDNMMAQRYVSLFNLPEGVKYRFYETDVAQESIEPHLNGVDVVVHLAAITNAAASFGVKEQTEKNNYDATEKVAAACVKKSCPLIYISTTSVYGTQAEKVDENCTRDELKPQSPYAETKLREEQLLNSLGKEHNLNYIICRFGTIFGTSPGMRFHTAVNKFCWQAVVGQPITVWRTALHQVRPYLALSDAVRALHFIMRKKIYDRQIYNVLTTNVTVNDILDAIKKHVGDINIGFVDTKIMNQLSYHVLNDKFRKLGFEPEGDLAKDIKATLVLLKNARTGAVT